MSIRVAMRPPRTGVIAMVASATILCTAGVCAGVLALGALGPAYFDRRHLPDPGPLERFEFPSIGRIYDRHDQPLIELALEHRQITQYLRRDTPDGVVENGVPVAVTAGPEPPASVAASSAVLSTARSAPASAIVLLNKDSQ